MSSQPQLTRLTLKILLLVVLVSLCLWLSTMLPLHRFAAVQTLRGPRAGMIFFRKRKLDGTLTDLEARVDGAVFPACQGGPHNNTIGAIAVALKQAADPEYKKYCIQVKKNSRKLAEKLTAYGYTMVTGGTDNHLILWDLRPQKFTGSKMEKICDAVQYVQPYVSFSQAGIKTPSHDSVIVLSGLFKASP